MRRIAGVLTLLLVFSSTVPAEAAWTRLQSANFLFVGDANERDIREIARQLEQFRAVLTRTLPSGAQVSPAPTIVFVFATDRSFTQYKPLFEGRPVELAGYYQSAEDVNYIALSVDRGAAAIRTIFHEFTHAFVANTLSGVPLWLNEGLAEFYEMVEERDGGRAAMVGAPAAGHVNALQQQFIPLDELMAVDHASRVYNEGNRRGIFYAESWALTHYLTLGNLTRAQQLPEYFSRLAAGANGADALRAAFGTDAKTLESELRNYIRRFEFPVVRIEFDSNLRDATSGRGVRIEDTEAQAYLADLLARVRRTDDARALVTAILSRQPEMPRALWVRARLEQQAGNLSDAQQLFERAANLAPDDGMFQASLGQAIVQQVSQGRPTDPAMRARAGAALERAIALLPNLAFAHSVLATLQMTDGGDLDRAESLLLEAIRLAPAREYYRLSLAQVYMRQQDLDRATLVLGPLVASANGPDVRERARTLLASVSQRRQQNAQRAASAASSAIDGRPAAATSAPRNPGPDPSATAPARNTVGATRAGPLLRVVGQGERRVLGMFEAVECRQNLIVLQIKADDRQWRLASGGFDQIDFISYRDDTPEGVNCGAMTPIFRVLATFRETTGSDVDGDVIAIELLPDGYTPR